MSLSILQTTDDFMFVGNPMWVMVSGTLNVSTDFKYGYYVDVDPENDNTYSNKSFVKQSQRPTDGLGVYDPRLVLRDYIPHISGNLNLSEYGINRDPSFIRYRIRAGEYTGATSVSTIQDVKVSGNALFGSIKTNEFPGFLLNDYLTNDASRKFMTHSPRTRKIYFSQHEWIYILQSYTVANMKVITYNSSGGVLGSYNIANSFNSTTDARDKFLRASVGTYQLAAIPSGSVSVITGTYPIITNSVDHYTIQLFNVIPGDISEIFTFQIVDANCKYTNIRIHFMSRFGRFDSFNFPLVSRKFAENERRMYQQPLGTRTGNDYAYTASDRGDTVYFGRSKEKLHIISDWLTGEEATWLQEFFDSPVIYMQTDSSTLIAMNVIGNSMEVKEKENGELILYEFDLGYANANEW